MKSKHLLAITLPVILAACGGSGGSSSTATATQTGVFKDSVVAGVAYKTATQSGYTNEKGEFRYLPGESVTFSIGGIQLPEAKAAALVTPLMLAGDDAQASAIAINIAQLLQTLDDDGNPENGISISRALLEQLKAVNLNVKSPDFDTAASTALPKPLVTEDKAAAHMNAALATAGIAGSWRMTQGDTDPLVLLTFLPDGTYVMAQDGDKDSSGQSGIERGSYNWNASTGEFKARPQLDTNGEWGLSHPQGTFNFTLKDGVLQVKDNQASHQFERLTPFAEKPLFGSWTVKAGNNDVLLTFYNTGKTTGVTKYLMVETGSNGCDLVSKEKPSACNGFEIGKYTWDSNTLNYQVLKDQTGWWGLSHASEATVDKGDYGNHVSSVGIDQTLPLTVSGDSLTLTAADNTTQPMVFKRVK
ncbi:hypothetical protein [Craterilacuibacter sinensis]|uniref:Adhesin n=1 Tax=Craterilacuibacter sinensis TaxID=2686017 RepID=A0A845BL73_9NEIS|nr:hypothetical protein [Craterilacuibacter sinensis]MXR37085.1 hypothetical protein [Craterilacuibacter sinensis]